jgi:hypothetical protein
MSHHQKSLPSLQAADTLARGLGWFSIGLGAFELFGAKSLCRWLGTEQHETLVRAYGAREIATGIGILASRDPKPWVWGRVAGDALDLATLAAAMTERRAKTDRVVFATAAVAGVTILDVICAESLGTHTNDEDYNHWDYSDRSGLPRSPQQMRGAARNFEVPRDMRIPDALRPYEQPERLAAPGRPM